MNATNQLKNNSQKYVSAINRDNKINSKRCVLVWARGMTSGLLETTHLIELSISASWSFESQALKKDDFPNTTYFLKFSIK